LMRTDLPLITQTHCAATGLAAGPVKIAPI
jgi:hypothetical protein